MWWVLAALVLQGRLPQIPVRDAEPAKPGTAIIRGHVTDKETGLPLSGIVIRIPPARGGDPVLETRSDAEGFYQLTRVPAGSHILVALMPDYRKTHLPQVYGDTRPPRAMWAYGMPPRIEIRDGEIRSGADFALARALGVSGRVLDDAGQPMSNVSIQVESLTSDDGSSAQMRDTDDRGEFRVFGLAPGRYRICAEPFRVSYTDAAPPDAPAVSCYPASGKDDDALVIGPADPGPIQIQMHRGGTVTISGTILDGSGVPAEGATLSLRRRTGPGPFSYGIPVWAGAQFTARGVSPGDYVLYASGGHAVDNGQIERQYAYLPLTIGSADLTGLAITLTRPVNLAGRVIIEGGEVLPPGTRLSVQARLDDRVASALNRTVPTGVLRDDMSFELTGVFGEATIWCNGLPREWVLKAVRYGGRDVTDIPFTPDGSPRSIDVVVSSHGGVASGTVALDEESAVAGGRAVVSLFPIDSSRWNVSSATATTLVSRSGTFSLQAVRPGEYFIAATDGLVTESARTRSAAWERLSHVAERITLGDGDRRTIELRVVRLPEER